MRRATGRYPVLGAQILLFALVSALLPSYGLASDTEQLLRIEKVIELDREKLAELQADVSKRQEFFDQLADGIGALEGDLAQRKARLDEITETGDPSERSTLQAEIPSLETELELFQTQSELAFSSLTTVREQLLSTR
jgi:chromosome segregation ATPase